MAVTHNSTGNTFVVGGSTASVVVTVAAGSNLAAAISICFQTENVAAISSVTFGGVTATFIQFVQGVTGIVEQYYVTGVLAGARTLSVSWDANVAVGVIGVEVMNDVHQTSPLGTALTGYGTTAAPTLTLTGTLAGSFVVDGVNVSVNTPSTVTPDATQTLRWSRLVGSIPDRITAGCSTELSAGGSVPMDWALSAIRDWAIAATEFRTIADTGKPVNCYTSYQYTADPTPIESFKDPAVQQRIWVNDRRHMQGDL